MTQGMKSSEFWLTLAAMGAGVYMSQTGTDLTVILAVIGGSGAYAVSRGLAKGRR